MSGGCRRRDDPGCAGRAFTYCDKYKPFYYPQTASTATAPAGECFTVRDGKIVENVLVFDRPSFGPPTAM